MLNLPDVSTNCSPNQCFYHKCCLSFFYTFIENNAMMCAIGGAFVFNTSFSFYALNIFRFLCFMLCLYGKLYFAFLKKRNSFLASMVIYTCLHLGKRAPLKWLNGHGRSFSFFSIDSDMCIV